jgi:hypothetical protein
MATLQDVRNFVRAQGDLTTDELERKVASEFNMSRDEAAQMMRGLQTEDPALDTPQPSLLGAAVVGAGLNQTQPGGTQNAAGIGALLVTESGAVRNSDLDVNRDPALDPEETRDRSSD